ncbi:MAG: membrane protein insertion efficiency factor YidD [candidate division Zixibacteria bacterium]|nr:membrane protein insertion efficiency factor YidD [candidate division Zixibacteria bacterium]
MKVLVFASSGLIRFYQNYVRIWFPPVCRFHPTCSEYALEALKRHGFFRGSAMAVRRIVRCNPFSAGGWDPVK